MAFGGFFIDYLVFTGWNTVFRPQKWPNRKFQKIASRIWISAIWEFDDYELHNYFKRYDECFHKILCGGSIIMFLPLLENKNRTDFNHIIHFQSEN